MNKYIENVKCPLCDGKKVFAKSSNPGSKFGTTCWHECEDCGPTDPISINSEKDKNNE